MISANLQTKHIDILSSTKLLSAAIFLMLSITVASSGECTPRTGRSIDVEIGFEVTASGKLTYKIKSCESRRGSYLKGVSYQIKDVVCARIPTENARSNCITGKEVLTLGTTDSETGCVNATLKHIAPGTAVTLVVNTKRSGRPIAMSFLLPEPPPNAVADMEERKAKKSLPRLDQSNYSRKKVATRILAAN